jgi:hypothetical protein
LAVVDLAVVLLPIVDLAAVVLAGVVLATMVLAGVVLATVDLAAVDLAAGGLADVDLAAADFVDFFALVALVEGVTVDCLVVDCAGANTAKAANRATGMEIAIARKDPV